MELFQVVQKSCWILLAEIQALVPLSMEPSPQSDAGAGRAFAYSSQTELATLADYLSCTATLIFWKPQFRNARQASPSCVVHTQSSKWLAEKLKFHVTCPFCLDLYGQDCSFSFWMFFFELADGLKLMPFLVPHQADFFHS